jgi:hypothetical protein
MLKVDFQNDVAGENHSTISVGGYIDKGSYCIESARGGWYCDLNDQTVYDKLLECNFEDVGKFIFEFNFLIRQSEEGTGCKIRVVCSDNLYGKIGIFVEFEFNADFWARPYSVVDFATIFEDIVKAENRTALEFTFRDDESLFNGFGIFWPVASQGEIIKPIAEKAVEAFYEFERKAEMTAIYSVDKENLVIYFSFPDDIKVACKQYLVYFAQFLLDLGVEAETEIAEQAEQTWFKIVPANKVDALDKIKEALDAYLNAPADPEFDLQTIQNPDVSIVQWQANVMHLKSQLLLAHSALQMKDATIEMLRLSNYQYQQLTLKDSQAENAKKEEDIIKGIVSVKHYEGKGFSVNLPEILRRLKRKFGRKPPHI